MPKPDASPGAASAMLPLPVPGDATQRLVLVTVRRMAAHGLRDAQAASLMIGGFGLHFRRPLVLLRAFMAEVAQASSRTITVAPCCALRMTRDEGRILDAIDLAPHRLASAALHLQVLTGGGEISGPLSLAAAFNRALADAGRPLGS
jgi:hypothetical protein